MNPQETLAIVKAIKEAAEKAARAELQPGDYQIDLSVRIAGSIKVGEDYEQRIVAKADPWLLFAVAMGKLNQTTVDAIVREALASNLTAEQVKKQAGEAIAAVKEPTLTACKGKVTTALQVTKITK